MNPNTHSHLLVIAQEAAIVAGKEILKIYDSEFDVDYKEDASPLTLADRFSNEVIMNYLSSSAIPVISEENKEIGYQERKSWDLFWLIDPMDGTKEFVKRNGEFTVNIALIQNGKPVLGVIYVPVKRELFYGSDEGGFKVSEVNHFEDLRHNKGLALTPRKPSERVVVVASRSHLTKETESYIDNIKLNKDVHAVETISAGSSLKLCMVAEGKADVYPRFAPTMEWDVAAGHAICRSVGIPVLQVATQTELRYNKRNLLNPWFVVGNRFGTSHAKPI